MKEETEQDSERAEAIAALTAQLRSRRARERRRALGEHGAEVVPALQSVLRTERLKKRQRRPLRWAYGGAILFFFLIFQYYLATPLAWGLIPVLGVLFVGLARLCAITPVQVEAIKTLAALDDVRAVGPLLEALELRDFATFTGVRAVATQALLRLLPRLRPEDAPLLDNEQRACLYRLMRHHPSDDQTELIIALLGAVAQVGDTQAVNPLERMTKDTQGGTPRQRVQFSAQAALTRLRQRLGRTPSTLLRAASDGPASELLHPANAAPPTEPTQLLRPSQNEQQP